MEIDPEIHHFQNVLAAFAGYRQESTEIVTSKLAALKNTPIHFKEAIVERLSGHYELICRNALFIMEIIDMKEAFYNVDPTENYRVPKSDHDKVRSTLRQMVREWSIDGKSERDSCYAPILNKISELYGSIPFKERGSIKILVPGAGLGRLPYEIVSMGYSTQGNEFSFFMLLASNLILNGIKKANSFEIYPWIHQHSNMRTESLQSMPVLVPDVAANNIPETADFSMAGGDFIEIYSSFDHYEKWDCIVTCFFIDTAKNMIDYLKVIKHALKTKGKWINLGPLLYHFEGFDEDSVEYTSQEFYKLVGQFGFKIVEDRDIDSVYASCPHSMMRHVYHNLFFVAEKE
jgi:carnosine N-methyltransferase